MEVVYAFFFAFIGFSSSFTSDFVYDNDVCGQYYWTSVEENLFSFKCLLPTIEEFDFTQLPGNITKGLQVNCTLTGVNSFKPGTLSHLTLVEVIVINHCNLGQLHNDTFKGLSSLTAVLINLPQFGNAPLTIFPGIFNESNLLSLVQITHASISELPNDLFCELKFLTEINLSYNMLTELDKIGCGVNNSCCPQLKGLYLQSNNVSRVKSKDFQFLNLVILDLTENKISLIENGALDSSVDLIGVSFMKNNLTEIEEKLFDKNVNLQEINLSFNGIQTLPSKIFKNLSSLRGLFLSNNEIKSLDEIIFSNLVLLENLDLSGNEIEVIPPEIWINTSSISSLNLENNKLTRIEEMDFQGLDKVEKLNLSRNNLKNISSSAFVLLKELTSIDLSYNQLTKIPNFPNKLTTIDLMANNISEIHETAFKGLTNLIGLRLRDNQIKSIPQSPFENLPNIALINLQNNLIEHIEMKTFSYSPFLKYLNLAFNNIRWMNSLFDKVSVYLDLSHNLITKFDFIAISKEVQEVDLSYNQIKIITNPREEQMDYKLKRFNINNNQLEVFFGFYFPPTIEVIDMSSNNISKFSSLSSAYLPNLVLLNLLNNSIREIELSQVKYNPEIPPRQVIPEIIISQNLLTCSCVNVWMKTYRSTTFRSFPRITGFTDCLPVNKRYLVPYRLVKIDAVPENNFVCEYDEIDNATQNCPNVHTTFQENGKKLCTCYHDYRKSVNIIDCGNVNWTNNVRVNVKFPFPFKATTIFLDNNQNVSGIEEKLMGNFTRLEELYLNSSKLTKVDRKLLAKCSTLLRLFLHSNKITKIVKGDFDMVPKVNKLHLHDNQISFLEESAFVVLKYLEELTLHRNYLHQPLLWEMGTSLRLISLSRNKISCNCNYTSVFQKWVSSKQFVQISDLDDVECYKLYLPIMEFNDSSCFPFITKNNHHLTIILSVTLSVVVILLILIIIMYIYRLEMQVLLYSHYGIRMFYHNEDADVGKTYDAFVSYSNEDDEWVAEEFITKLTEYKLCLHQRDFPVGGLIIDSIVYAVENSCRTVLILTPSFLESEWCMFEFKSAHMQCLQDRCKRLIVIILDEKVKSQLVDKELQAYLKTNTYLEWNDKLFWEKLKFAMPDLKRRV